MKKNHDNYFSSFTSLIDSIEFTCKDWTDPEKIGISAYVLYTTDLGTNVKVNSRKYIMSSRDVQVAKPMLKLTKFDPSNPSTIRMAPGNYSFEAEIVDTWGAKAFYQISTRTEFIIPTNEERIDFEESGVKEETKVIVFVFTTSNNVINVT